MDEEVKPLAREIAKWEEEQKEYARIDREIKRYAVKQMLEQAIAEYKDYEKQIKRLKKELEELDG